jgi:hypothetical protein
LAWLINNVILQQQQNYEPLWYSSGSLNFCGGGRRSQEVQCWTWLGSKRGKNLIEMTKVIYGGGPFSRQFKEDSNGQIRVAFGTSLVSYYKAEEEGPYRKLQINSSGPF